VRIVIVSATSVIAQSCVREWAASGSHSFELVGRSSERLDAVAADFRIRYPDSTFNVSILDFDSAESVGSLVKRLVAKPIDLALIAQGSLTEQQRASSSLDYLKAELELNAVSVAVTTEAFAGAFMVQGFGTLGVIGSVAGDRGRAYNYSYGSSKSLIETYTQGLQQRFAHSKVSVCLIKPGPTATPMTANHKGKMSDPGLVAKEIVAGLNSHRRVIYAPGPWRLVMFVVRLIPFTIFKRLKF
jgi:decaprenylphospho-beta-D-erythro-pentofuranosid-2-ulose 2-reductase